MVSAPGKSEVSTSYLAIGVAMVSISFASIFIKWSESPPFIIAAYRLLFSCGILLPFMLWSRGFSELRNLDRKELALIVLSGVALMFHFQLWIVSLTLTLVSTSVILVTSHPIFVAAISRFLLKEEVKRIAAAGIVIAFAGVAVIAVTDYGVGKDTLFGDLLAFIGGICAGVYFLSGRVARQKVSLATYAFSVYLLAATPLFVSAVFAGDGLVVTDGRELTLFLAMAVFPTMLGHTMFNYALKRVPAHIISTSVLGEPVGASILAYALLPGEVPNEWIVLGGGLVIFGLYIVLSRGYRPKAGADIPID